MKTLLRIAIIVVVALVVTGATYAIGNTEWAAERAQNMFSHGMTEGGQPPEGFERPEGEGEMPEGFQSPEGATRPEGGHGANPFSAASLLAFTQTLIPMALVIVVVTLATKGINAIQQRASSAAKPQV